MKLQTVAAAMLALTIAACPALACKGEEIFSEDFSSSDGPWANAPWFKIAGGAAEFKLEAGSSGFIPYLGGNFKEFDLCVDIVIRLSRIPKHRLSPGSHSGSKTSRTWWPCCRRQRA